MESDVDWKKAFEVAATQRDNAVNRLMNLEIELELLRDKLKQNTETIEFSDSD